MTNPYFFTLLLKCFVLTLSESLLTRKLMIHSIAAVIKKKECLSVSDIQHE